jgi:hypothetical protein
VITDAGLSFNTNDEKAAEGLYPHGIETHPRIKPRPQSTHHLWWKETRLLFDQAFANGSQVARPSAQEWAGHFENLLTTKSLVRCEKLPNDVSHMRFRNMPCATCYLKSLPAFVLPTTTSKLSRAPESSTAPVPAQVLPTKPVAALASFPTAASVSNPLPVVSKKRRKWQYTNSTLPQPTAASTNPTQAGHLPIKPSNTQASLPSRASVTGATQSASQRVKKWLYTTGGLINTITNEFIPERYLELVPAPVPGYNITSFSYSTVWIQLNEIGK